MQIHVVLQIHEIQYSVESVPLKDTKISKRSMHIFIEFYTQLFPNNFHQISKAL